MTNGASGGALEPAHDPVATNLDDDESLTISGAAAACGVDRKEIERLNRQGEFPNAWRADPEPGRSAFQSLWRIPVDDLRNAGLTPGVARESSPHAYDDEAELELLRSERDEWQRRALVAEAVAVERLHALEDTRQALNALAVAMGGRSVARAEEEQPVVEEEEPEEAEEVFPAARLRGNWLR
jgi:hypothetical protein